MLSSGSGLSELIVVWLEPVYSSGTVCDKIKPPLTFESFAKTSALTVSYIYNNAKVFHNLPHPSTKQNPISQPCNVYFLHNKVFLLDNLTHSQSDKYSHSLIRTHFICKCFFPQIGKAQILNATVIAVMIRLLML